MAGPAAGRLVLFGIDPHKATHTVVAVDELGRQLAQHTVAARTPQHRELIIWARTTADDKDRSGRSRTADTCLGAWSGTCWLPGSGSCGCRPS
jgi:transposase